MPGTCFLRISEVFSTTRRGFPYCVAAVAGGHWR